MATRTSHSTAETQAIGAEWGRIAEAGLIIGLTGDLGAGKTQFVKGLARGLGITEVVHSPTFGLIHEYHSGRLPLFHLDLYRLETPDQVFTAGLEEYLPAPNGVSVVEWVEHWLGTVPHPDATGKLPVRLSGPLRWFWIEARGETERIITYEDFGA